MATAKAKTTKKSSTRKISKPAAVSKSTATAAKSEVGTKTITVSKHPVKDFFGRKYDSAENILTIFKSPRIIGAILGEIIGTMALTMILLTLGINNPLYLVFGILAISVGVFAISGAHLNPAITVGMMASRRVSAIRGTLYIIAQVLGAWFAMLIVTAFRSVGGDSAAAVPQITAVESSLFWAITMVEFIGAIIIGFFFARALIYKRSVFTFGAVVACGIFIAILVCLVITNNYMLVQDAFVLNPAVAIMYQVLPSEAADFGTLLGEIGKALTTYAIFPMLGAAVGFYLSDFTSKLSGEKTPTA